MRILILLLFISPGLLAQEHRLEYRLSPDKEYQLYFEIRQDTKSESFFNEEISMYNQLGLNLRVDSTDKQGGYYMTAAYSELLISMLAPQLGIDINSSSSHNPLLSGMVGQLEQDSFNLRMSRFGDLLSVSGLQEAFDRLQELPAADSLEKDVIIQTLNDAYGSRNLEMLFNLFLSYFPKVHPMQNWTKDFNCYLNSREVPSTNRYYLSKTTDKQLTIQGIGMLTSQGAFEETTTIGMVKSAVSGSQTFDFHIDKESCWMIKCVSRQRLMIEATVISSKSLPEGLKMPSFTETYFEVSGDIVGNPEKAKTGK